MIPQQSASASMRGDGGFVSWKERNRGGAEQRRPRTDGSGRGKRQQRDWVSFAVAAIHRSRTGHPLSAFVPRARTTTDEPRFSSIFRTRRVYIHIRARFTFPRSPLSLSLCISPRWNTRVCVYMYVCICVYICMYIYMGGWRGWNAMVTRRMKSEEHVFHE